ncbi:MAG TPA: class I SAM-dependent methyltransferase [Longimicrobiaceae bacterium]|nr:class I SAM-dependent methyltransferase [Longimicrobiaceae bacterium]
MRSWTGSPRVGTAAPVADVGCGPGHVAAYLHAQGVSVRGIDLSSAMVRHARTLFPEIPFDTGDVIAIDAGDGSWAGAVAFYSLIHLPRGEMAAALRELHRVLRPDAPLVLAFHVGAEVRHFDELWGEPVDLDFVFFTAEEMDGYLRAAGFTVESREERDAYPEVEAQTRRCYVVARASGPAARSGAGSPTTEI